MTYQRGVNNLMSPLSQSSFSNYDMNNGKSGLDPLEEEKESTEPATDPNESEKDKYLKNPKPYTSEAYENYISFFRNFISLDTQVESVEKNKECDLQIETDEVHRGSESDYQENVSSETSDGLEEDEAFALIERSNGRYFSDSINHIPDRGLIQESIQRIAKLSILPDSKIRKTSHGTYLNPHVTMGDINHFLDPYLRRCGYAGISISMSTNEIYARTYENRLFTAIYFKRNEKTLFRSTCHHLKKAWDSVCLFQESEIGWRKRKEELEMHITSMIEKWGYACFDIGNVKEEFFSNSETKVDYELYLLLDYKRLEN